MTDPYLIWSNEHRAWWGPEACGYTPHLPEAGRYSREGALRVVARAIPGTAQGMGMMPELPVRLADVEAAMAAYRAGYPGRGREPWE